MIINMTGDKEAEKTVTDETHQREHIMLQSEPKKLLSRRTTAEDFISIGGGDDAFDALHSISASKSNSKKPKEIVMFEPLEEGGERYVREHMGLPPIEPMSFRKYYVNLHPTESDMSSSVNCVDECWNYFDYDELQVQNHYTHSRKLSEDELKDNEDIIQIKKFSRTEKVIRERKLQNKQNKEKHNAQIISNLEKQMASLYNIKKQYKRTLQVEGCKKIGLPPVRESNQMTRQRDLIIERIKRKTVEKERNKQKQIERKFYIVKKLLEEQRTKELNHGKLLQMRQQIKNRKLGKDDTEEEIMQSPKIGQHEAEGLVEDAENDIEPRLVSNDEAGDNNIYQEAMLVGEDAVATVKQREDIENSEKKSSENPRKSSKTKKSKKKDSVVSTGKKADKKDKKKKKKSEEIEVPAATCEETPELPASKVPDLRLWFENWRENHENQIHWEKQLEAEKLPVDQDIVLNPDRIIFKNVRARRVTRQAVTVINVSESVLQCQVEGVVLMSEVTDTSPILEATLDGPRKARTGTGWTVTVTLETLGVMEEDAWAELRLQFCREDGYRTSGKVEVEVLLPRAQPVLSTACIRFGPQVFWNEATISKHLQISNPGSEACVISWVQMGSIDIMETNPVHQCKVERNEGSHSSNITNYSFNVEQAAREMVDLAFKNVFNVFSIDAWPNTLLLPKSLIYLPITFRPAMTSEKGDVFASFKFTFEGNKVENSEQDLVACGYIEDSPFKLEPEVLDMKVCYIGGTVQQAQFCVQSRVRHACSVSARVPRALAQEVKVLPKDTIVQGCDCVTLVLRIMLRWTFLVNPCAFFDEPSGLLSFPVLVYVQDNSPLPAPPMELRVMALVLPPCPLSLTPSLLHLGQVSTFETVYTLIRLINHQLIPYNFKFLNLPQGVMIEPGGGCGTILPKEVVDLRVLYSPRAGELGVDCGRPGSEGETTLILRCYTTISLASPKQKKEMYGPIPPAPNVSLRSTISGGDFSIRTKSAENRKQVKSFTSEVDDRISSDTPSGSNRKSLTGEDEREQNMLRLDNESSSSTESIVNVTMLSERFRSEDGDLWHYYSAYELNGNKQKQYDQGNRKDKISNISEIQSPSVDLENNRLHEEIEINSILSAGDGPVASEEHSVTVEDGMIPPADQQTIEVNASCDKFMDQNQENLQELNNDPDPSQRYASVCIQAFVVDPLVELSSQAVVMPPTPCGSYSIAHVYIRSRLQRKCAIHERITRFKTTFEFKSPNPQLSVEPRKGSLNYKQRVKISLIFRPTLSQQEIYKKALEIKIESLKWKKIQEMLDQYYQAQEKKQPKRTSGGSAKKASLGKKSLDGQSKRGSKVESESKKKKTSVVSKKTKKGNTSLTLKTKKKDSGPLPDAVIDPTQVEVTKEDLRDTENWLLKYLESHTEDVTVACLLETEMDENTRRQETLFCRVLCPTVPPTIALTSPPCLDFGPTALGARPKLHAHVTNLSFFDALVSLSTVNPVGPFMCTAALETPLKMRGKELELPPEHVLSIPVMFQPTSAGQSLERIQVMSGSTTLELQARGEGVIPSYTFIPDLEVFTVTCAAGKKADIIIKIENSCEAPLSFNIRQEYLKEGQALPSPNTPPLPSPDSGMKQKNNPKKEKKSRLGLEFDSLTPELANCLENEFVASVPDSTIEPMFKIIDVVERINVLARETKAVTVRFTPPQAVRSRSGTRSSIKTKAAKGGKLKKSLDREIMNKSPTSSDKPGTVRSDLKNAKNGKSNKKEEVPSKSNITKDGSKRIIATKFNIYFANTKMAKQWVFLATVKK